MELADERLRPQGMPVVLDARQRRPARARRRCSTRRPGASTPRAACSTSATTTSCVSLGLLEPDALGQLPRDARGRARARASMSCSLQCPSRASARAQLPRRRRTTAASTRRPCSMPDLAVQTAGGTGQARDPSAAPPSARRSSATSRWSSLHGHVHESAGFRRIGKTLAVNPGSDYGTGCAQRGADRACGRQAARRTSSCADDAPPARCSSPSMSARPARGPWRSTWPGPSSHEVRRPYRDARRRSPAGPSRTRRLARARASRRCAGLAVALPQRGARSAGDRPDRPVPDGGAGRRRRPSRSARACSTATTGRSPRRPRCASDRRGGDARAHRPRRPGVPRRPEAPVAAQASAAGVRGGAAASCSRATSSCGA